MMQHSMKIVPTHADRMPKALVGPLIKTPIERVTSARLKKISAYAQ